MIAAMLPALAINLAVLMIAIMGLWAIAVRIRDVSFIDSFWAAGMVLLAWTSWFQADDGGARAQLLLALTSLWGLRLALHLLIRWRRTGEDPRYKRILGNAMDKKQWGFARAALILVFLTQAPLLFITSLPAQIGILASHGQDAAAGSIGWLAVIGTIIAIIGIGFETMGDWQLEAFKANPANHGKVLNTGLWRYTRHPNYFGDACTWWGIWLVAAEAGPLVALLTLPGPLFLNFTLVKWSGKALLERGLKKTRPGYEDYIRRTSGFFPWPPKQG